MHYVALRYLLKLRQDATPWQTATCFKQGNPLYSNHQDLLYDRFLPPTRLGLRVSGYACACYALTGRSGLWLFLFLYPGLTPWATELPSRAGLQIPCARWAQLNTTSSFVPCKRLLLRPTMELTI